MSNELKDSALHYHRWPVPGKLQITPTKPLANQRDLALAYSPGVAAACEAIVEDPAEAATVTARGNLVAVISNGTAVLGLGNIGGLASKPVMEGKAVLFKKFAGIDVFDIELNEQDPEKVVDIVTALEPTFGAVNLEDIKAPDCFIIEQACRERMSIPVFHDDQHGTAIVVAAAVLNGLRLVEKKPDEVRIVSTGGGAAGIACLNQLLAMGVKRENVTLVDHKGVVFEGRTEDMTPQKADYAVKTDARTLADAIPDADVFLGLSAPGILTGDMVKAMAAKPLILALANPMPEILPDEAKAAVPDAIVATGRSDFPNQVNNVLCFPFIFRGALDCGATEINEEMKLACVEAIADLTMESTTEQVASAYGEGNHLFGPEYLIPKPFDPRLISRVAPAVAKAAMESGVATRPIEDMAAYRAKLERFVYRTGFVMKPVFDKARENPKRVVFAEGEDDRVLFATQVLLEDQIAVPILIGRPSVVEMRIKRLGLPLTVGKDFEIVNPEDDPRYRDYWTLYHSVMERQGVTPDVARTVVRTRPTVIATLMVKRGEADAMICGTVGAYEKHLDHVESVLGLCGGCDEASALTLLLVNDEAVFMADTQVTEHPTVDELVDITVRAAEKVADFGIAPKIGMISTSNFGSRHSPTSDTVHEAVARLHKEHPDLEVEGEMQPDVALDPELRERVFPNSKLQGQANLLIMPSLNAANISLNLVKHVSNGLVVGPMLLGVEAAAHITTPSVTSRGLVNLAAVAVVDAQNKKDS